jgi:transcription antitermination factor NusG
MDLLAAQQKASTAALFRVGDAVKVVEGDLKHLVGAVTQVSYLWSGSP